MTNRICWLWLLDGLLLVLTLIGVGDGRLPAPAASAAGVVALIAFVLPLLPLQHPDDASWPAEPRAEPWPAEPTPAHVETERLVRLGDGGAA